MRAIGICVVLAVILAVSQAKPPKWKQSLKHKKHELTVEEHRKYCGDVTCPEHSGCKVKRGGNRVKAICVKCRPCGDEKEAFPVCGTDGNDYPSRCKLRYQACMQNKLGLLKVKCGGSCADCTEGSKMVQHNRPVLKAQREEPEEEEEVEKPALQESYQKSVFSDEIKEQQDNCTRFENATLGARLLDWFHVLRAEYIKTESRKAGHPVDQPIFPKMDIREAHVPFPCGHSHQECREPINFMFHFLDKDGDHVLGPEELAEVKEIPNENCITQFFEKCDATKDGQFSLLEFCECFPIEPPCLARLKGVPTLLQRGRPVPLPGHFIPHCDSDGFYNPTQCHTKLDEEYCWCVDRNGGKIEGSYQKGMTKCPDNTVNEREAEEL
ncbi:predicted protein [Nematostella vectensis]|uniref:Uncharacterized protein n=1 Tax=Nematostella vectensis TaxID=45351 RepID=A7RFR0_NEMVE|nr:predicted protein [Nematostella vectensis]|eukprot:XP_001641707.1 predicted protein [Nematostella vectensis]